MNDKVSTATSTVDPNRLVGACRQISCYLSEGEIVELNKLFDDTIDKWVRKRGRPTVEECQLADGLMN